MMENDIYLVYTFGGFAMFMFATYLLNYYCAHGNRIDSSYFKRLCLVFIAPAYFGLLFSISGIVALCGLRMPFSAVVPYVSAVGIIIAVITLGLFVVATNKA
jgi:hypothetical protein